MSQSSDPKMQAGDFSVELVPIYETLHHVTSSKTVMLFCAVFKTALFDGDVKIIYLGDD